MTDSPEQPGAPLAGRVALVTGTSPNIGAGIALAMSNAGAAIACVDASAAHAKGCAALVREHGGIALAVECDVTDGTQVATAVAQIRDELGTPRILVNNATRYVEKGILDLSVEDWRSQLDVILTGSFLLTQQVAGWMIADGVGGTILNLISTAGHQGQAGNVGYSTAKAGLINFTRATAMDLARYGIRVNSLTPTSTDPVEMIDRAPAFGGMDPARAAPIGGDGLTEVLRERLRRVPLGRLPRPSDYGAAAVFLCSDAALMITGTDLRVDGGVLARYWGWIEEAE